MKRFKVLIENSTIPRIAHEILKKNCEVIVCSDFGRESVLKNISGVHGLFWAGGKLDKELLDAAGPQLKMIGTMSSGLNHIDLKEVKARGIKLANTPKVIDKAVADIAILLALATSRRFTEGRKQLEQGNWIKHSDKNRNNGLDIDSSTIGIIGFGGIGQAIVKRLKGYDVNRILYTGHQEKPEGKELGAIFVDKDTLIKESDFIFISAPLTNDTKHMCNDDFFGKMKKTGIFINVSRGELVDQDALIRALKENKIFAAGLDVMYPEPLNTDNELLSLTNVVLTPHIGACTISTRHAMAELNALNILRGLKDEELLTPVEL